MSVAKKSSLKQTIRLWKIADKGLQEIEKTKLDLEEKLEDWISSDASVISPDLLVIGRQIQTDFGGAISAR